MAKSANFFSLFFCFFFNDTATTEIYTLSLHDALPISTAIVTGPMPRNPKATSPNANTAGANINPPSPVVLTPYAIAMRVIMVIPNQNALKFPATKPERMFSEAPPSRDEVTISRVWREPTEVKTFTNSGMIAPASVPQVITSDNFHHSVGSPPMLGIRSRDARKVRPTETSDVSQTSVVSGAS